MLCVCFVNMYVYCVLCVFVDFVNLWCVCKCLDMCVIYVWCVFVCVWCVFGVCLVCAFMCGV